MVKIEQKDLDPVLEGVKQFIRVGLLAVIPVAINQLGEGVLDLKVLVIAFVIAVLTGVEKGFHEQGKNSGEMNPISKVLELKAIGE